jgi:hypothetical protein
VPDLEVLCRLFLQTAADPESQWFVQRMIMGGQIEPFDFHKTGFSFGILCGILRGHGFDGFRRVKSFGSCSNRSTPPSVRRWRMWTGSSIPPPGRS